MNDKETGLLLATIALELTDLDETEATEIGICASRALMWSLAADESRED